MAGNIQPFDAAIEQINKPRTKPIWLTALILLAMLVLTSHSNAENNQRLNRHNRAGPELKLSPNVRAENYRDHIAAIDNKTVQAFLNAPLVTDNSELSEAAYIVSSVDRRLIMGKYDQFYARGLKDQSADWYQVFRPGRHFVDPISNESLGWEARHVGDARLLNSGDPARLSLLNTYGDVAAKDRLRPFHRPHRANLFQPKAPKNIDTQGIILSAQNRLSELGPLSVVVLNLGERDQVSVGDVFRIVSQGHLIQDPVNGENYRLPQEKIGLLMVFRTFEKVSYALVTNAARPIKLYDIVVSPEAR